MDDPKDGSETPSLTRESFFPTLVYYRDLPGAAGLNAAIKPHIYDWREQDAEGIVRSNVKRVGSWHSTLDMALKPEYRPLVDQIVAYAGVIFDDLGYDPAFEPFIDNMWANLNPRYGYNRGHTHPNVLWSGVYYVQSNEASGRIIFIDPRAQAHVLEPRYAPSEKRKAEAWSEVYYQPVEGRIILFPAWLQHEVEPNLSDAEGPAGDRISVSFNIGQRPRPSAAE